MTANTTMLGFVPDPAGRGTFGILWSCLTTLGLCAWTSLHLDLPSKKEFTDFYNHPFACEREKRIPWKFFWMLITLLIPECIWMYVVEGWSLAYQAMRHVNQEGELSGTDVWTMDDGFFSEMGGFTHNGETVHARKIVELIKDKTIPPQPSRATEIRDKSKSDALGKTLTCAQALWLAIQCLARAFQHLPMSTLEFGTIGYVFIAIAINGLFWYKPKDVLMPLEVLSWETRGISRDGEELDAHVDTPARDVANEERERLLEVVKKPPKQVWLDRVADDHDTLQTVMVTLVCVLYGGWHCLAWNFVFPSVAETWLWHIASILTSLPGFVLMLSDSDLVDSLPTQIQDRIDRIVWILVSVLYIVSRGFIFVEMFIGLRRLPAGVFDTVRWTTFLPHV